MTGLNWKLALGLFAFALLATAGWSETRQGLMWNKTGLPAVFPLIVQTDPGRDYVFLLRDADTDDARLAAYAVGGERFRVLVPPGTFYLHALFGTGWDEDETRFTDTVGAGRYDHPDPLTFQVKGLATKAGHRVDLRGVHNLQSNGPTVTAHRLCQRVRTTIDRSNATLTRPEFDHAWLENQRNLLPDMTRLPADRNPAFPPARNTALIDLSKRNEAFLRYQNDQPPLGIVPPDARIRIGRDIRVTLCD